MQPQTNKCYGLAQGCWSEANHEITCDFPQPKWLLVQVFSQQHAAWGSDIIAINC